MATMDPLLFRKAGQDLADQAKAMQFGGNITTTDLYGQVLSKIFSSTWPAFTIVELILLFLSYMAIFIVRKTRINDVADEWIKDKKTAETSIWRYGWMKYAPVSSFRAVATLLVHLTLPFAVYSIMILFSPQFAEIFQYSATTAANSLGFSMQGIVYSTVLLYILYIVISGEVLELAYTTSASKISFISLTVVRLLINVAIAICVGVSWGHWKTAPAVTTCAGGQCPTSAVLSTIYAGFVFSLIALGCDFGSVIADVFIAFKHKK